MHEDIQKLTASVGKVIVGKDHVLRCVIAGLLCGGHILIEDVPGVGKTQLAAALSRSVGGSFNLSDQTEDMAQFEQVRIPCFDEKGRATDARSFATALRKHLAKAPYEITSKVMVRGLGEAVLVLGEK